MQKALPAVLFCLLLNACSNFGFPGVYRLDIQQGNLVKQEQIDQLQPGMTRAQVRYVLGTPLLVDTFNQDRWEYLYSIQKGGGERRQERLTVFFEGDRLVGFSGDFLPGAGADHSPAVIDSGTGPSPIEAEPPLAPALGVEF